MLHVKSRLPEGIFDCTERELHALLGGPTLFHLPGRRKPPLFVTILLHGNEDSGWRALREILRDSRDGELPRALSLLIGNTEAAAEGMRYLPDQRDFNRVWPGEGIVETGPEERMARLVVEEMKGMGVFASVDIHNNTGTNPHYACLRKLDNRTLHLAALFSRTVVCVRRPPNMQMEAFSSLCPAVTVECGRRGTGRGASHVREYVEACLHLSELPDHPLPDHDVDLFHTVATVKVGAGISFGFGNATGAVVFRPDLDRLNFQELPMGTVLGESRLPLGEVLDVRDESGREAGGSYFEMRGERLVTKVPFMPSMFTVDIEAVRLDCLGYLMERLENGTVSTRG